MDVEQYENIKKYCDSFSTPTALLDGEMVCIYCNTEGFFNKGEKLGSHLLTMIKRPVLKSAKAKVIIDENIYCARVTLFGGEFYICEFLDYNEMLSIARFTDTYNVTCSKVGALGSRMSSLWKGYFALTDYLHKNGDFDTAEKVLEFNKVINSLSSSVSNLSRYIDVAFSDENETVIEVYREIKGLILYCNTILEGCGKAIEFIADVDNYYIYSNRQHMITALINALQNALLYSPNKFIPIITLSSVLEGTERYVVFRVVNDSIFFQNEKNGVLNEKNFVFQHAGLGIPIIKSFAEKAGGIFSMAEQDGRVIVELKIPQYIPVNDDELVFESPGYTYYKTDVPDFIDTMMNDVVNFFGKN